MDDDSPEAKPEAVEESETEEHIVGDEIVKLRNDFTTRLITANLRTEAVRAGMVDLDGLKLIDLSNVELDASDEIVGGRKLMTELRRTKPWLFKPASTSSAAVPPASLPMRQRTAMDMTDEEYAAARVAVTKYHF